MANSTSSFFLCLLFVGCVNAKYDQKLVPDYIRSEGYPVEEHFVTTKSGYILGVHRIPFGKLESNATLDKAGKPVVLLQHGFAGSSDSWVLLGSEQALGFVLADRGYDVWMINSRGNKYSTNHTKYNMSRSSDLKKFYDYSFHEKGVEDLPTTIDYILRTTDRNDLSLYTHSEGALIFYVMGAKDNRMLRRVNVAFHLAPMVYLTPYRSIFFNLVAVLNQYYLLGMADPVITLALDFMYNLMDGLSHLFLTRGLSQLPFQALFGSGVNQISRDVLSRVYDYFPNYVSSKELQHLAQIMNSGKLREFNYGVFNVLHFQLFVPVYNLDRVRVPSHIFYGGQDLVVSPASVNTTLYKQLSAEPPRMYFARHFGHYDFIYGRDAFNDVYNVTLDLLEEYVKD